MGQMRVMWAGGKPALAPFCRAWFRRFTRDWRAAVAAVAWRAMESSRAASHAWSGRGVARRRARWDWAVSWAAIWRAWAGSRAYTRRSRKRRRPEAGSRNRVSIWGVSQITARRAAISDWVLGGAPSRRKARRSGAAGSLPVPISSLPVGVSRRAAMPQVGAGPCGVRRGNSAVRAPRRPRPGVSRETASSRLVLPLPLGPVMTMTRPWSPSSTVQVSWA